MGLSLKYLISWVVHLRSAVRASLVWDKFSALPKVKRKADLTRTFRSAFVCCYLIKSGNDFIRKVLDWKVLDDNRTKWHITDVNQVLSFNKQLVGFFFLTSLYLLIYFNLHIQPHGVNRFGIDVCFSNVQRRPIFFLRYREFNLRTNGKSRRELLKGKKESSRLTDVIRRRIMFNFRWNVNP